ncbi:MAG: DUF1549 domain-containing protein, partial [Planctomycetales bacterium]|nr:DUF1549 domain-containing protein [Planctomycetales bacterium]
MSPRCLSGWVRAAGSLLVASSLFCPAAFAQSLSLTTGRVADAPAVIAGRDGVQQLVVTWQDEAGRELDVTREVTYSAEPAGIVNLDSTGLVTPISEGAVRVRATHSSGAVAETDIHVSHIINDLPINFPNEVVPLFTKHGCNGGGCHGKSSGQNGFRLSLLGFEPREDFEFLTKEARGRRLFPAAPDRSLLLLKGAAVLPHGGGARLEVDSAPYRVLHRWISQGMPYGSDSDPVAESIEVFPKTRVMEPGQLQQLVVIAHYSDGSTRDVTRMTQLNSNDGEMAEVNPSGLVTTHEQAGTVAVMCIFQGHVDVFRATLPLGQQVANLPPESNYVDSLVFDQLKRLGLPPSEVCDDGTFLRRATITIAGRVPTLDEARSFAADNSADKRVRLVNRLLDSTDYADNFATKWSAILRNKRSKDDDKAATFAFYNWIRDSLYDNVPYDQFVRDIITATGDVTVHAPVAWYRELKEPSAMVEDTAQLFLGMRIQCARCHHHPFEKWSQRDYHAFSAFYSRIGRKSSDVEGQQQIFHKQGAPSMQNPKTGENLVPAGLDADPQPISPLDDPRDALAD